MRDVQTAVVTGGHSFDVINFHRLLRELEGVDAYIQHMEDFTAASETVRDSYGAIVFYTMLREEVSEKLAAVMNHIGDRPQGLVFLHHGLLAYPDWPLWDEMVGLTGRRLTRYSHDEQMPLAVADTTHPVTAGLADWTVADETYLMGDAGGDNHILLTTDHADSMNTLAWVRQYRQCRVVCLQLGHDNQVWADAGFRRFLQQAIVWSSGHLTSA